MKNHTEDYLDNPQAIIEESFKIIDDLTDLSNIPEISKPIIRRVIHATGDVDYAHKLIIHHAAIECGVNAIIAGKSIVTDVNMVRVGISEKGVGRFGGKIVCKIAEEDIAAKAKELNKTRAITAIQESVDEISGGIVVIGNAPTAVFTIIDLIRREVVSPALVVAVPVGFVKAAESKEALRVFLDNKEHNQIPYITNLGRKGGSAVAVSIINALINIAKNTSE